MASQGNPDHIRLTPCLHLDVAGFPEEMRAFLRDRRPWLTEVSELLFSLRLEDEVRDYPATVSRYFYLFTLPVFEAVFRDFSKPEIRDLLKAHFWLGLHVRFTDDVLDNDSDGIGFETAQFLSSFCLAQSLELLGKSAEYGLDPGTLWPAYRKLFAFQVEMVRPFQQVSFSDYASRHWERGAPMFWMPEQILPRVAAGEAEARELLEGLWAFFDLFVAVTDLPDLLPDYRHFLNTPATLLLHETSPAPGSFPDLESFHRRFFDWVRSRHHRASDVAEKYSLRYTSVVLGAIEDSYLQGV